jgi:aminopeptidase YwaD
MFRYATVPFSGGSDHYIFSDPSIGVPMPMLIQWPDRFYHTSADTLERVSPESLSQACQLAGTYMYWLAAAGPREVDWLAHEMLARYKSRIVGNLQEAVTGNLASQTEPGSAGIPWREQLDYWTGRQQAAFASLRRLEPGFDPRPWSRSAAYFADGEWTQVSEVLDRHGGRETTETKDAFEPKELAARVPKRRFPGPVNEQSLARHHSPELVNQLFELQAKYKDLPRVLPALALYWTDGQRTLSEIVQRVAFETGVRAPRAIAEYFQVLAKLGAIHW